MASHPNQPAAGTAQTPADQGTASTPSLEEQWKEYHQKMAVYQQQQQAYQQYQQQQAAYRHQQAVYQQQQQQAEQWRSYRQQQQAWQQQQQYQRQQAQTAAFQNQMKQHYQNVHPTVANKQNLTSNPPYNSNTASTLSTVSSNPQQNTQTAKSSSWASYSKQPPLPAHPQPPPSDKSQPSTNNLQSSPAKAPVKNEAKENKSKKDTKQKGGFPPALQRYVERSIQECLEDRKLREEVEQDLKYIIEESMKANDTWNRDWENEPLPSRLLLSKRTVNKRYNKYYDDDSSGSRSPRESPRSKRQRLSLRDNGESGKRGKGKKKKKKGRLGDAKNEFVSRENFGKLSQRSERFKKMEREKDAPAVRWDPYRAMKDRENIRQAMEDAEYYGTKLDLSTFSIKGTCTDLEKPYLRLTSAPDPSSVRPEDILHKSLKNVMRKWSARGKSENGGKDVTYLWACEQLKSIRQDLTIQHIMNEFTCRVYETHARISIEQEDLKEFNQCQTKLLEMYSTLGSPACHREFAAYRILYQVYTRYKYNQPSSEMATLLSSLTDEQRKSAAVHHALRVSAAVDQMDYSSFFRLYKTVPNMGVYLLDLVIDYVRHGAIQRIFRAVRPSIPLNDIHDCLLYGSAKGGKNSEDWQNFIEKKGMCFLKEGKPVSGPINWANVENIHVDTKKSWSAVNGTFVWKILDGDNVNRG